MQKTNVFKYIDMKGGDASQCWPWTGALGKKNERPYVRVGKKVRLAYQVVWELVNGDEIGTRLIRHTCDNPVCCNPQHLKIGTQRENMKDMRERERHGIPKIVKNAWLNLAAKGVKPQIIADRYGVSAVAVRQYLKDAVEQAKEQLYGPDDKDESGGDEEDSSKEGKESEASSGAPDEASNQDLGGEEHDRPVEGDNQTSPDDDSV